ncbi:hypothetical protein [Cohnella panacarvi]|nr:hypothetical protein [Cohnella panacarvi]
MFKFDLNFDADVSLLSIIGAALAVWAYRKT